MTRRFNYKRYIICLLVINAAAAGITFMGNLLSNQSADAKSLDAFDPGYIISDYVMGNYNSMTEAEIQAFLTKKNSCSNTNKEYYDYLSQNSKYKWHWKDDHFVCLSEELFGDGEIIGEGETAAHIIWQAAQDYKINPQVLLVLLEKETSLVTDRIPNNGDYRKATGYGCPDTAACSEKYYGFKNQIRNAANLFHIVLTGGWTNFPLGKNYIQYNPNKDCGGSEVNIQNLATSALYRYTPYQPNQGALDAGYGTAYCGAYGNRNFYLYFEDWFGGITSDGIITAPKNLRATRTSDSIRIIWEAPDDVEIFGKVTYEVVLANADKKEYKVTVDGDKREYLFTELAAGKYVAASVKVIARSSSAFARIAFDQVVGTAPATPTDLKVEQVNGDIKVSWKKPTDDGGLKITGYEVTVVDNNKKEFKKEVDGNSEQVIFQGLPFNKYVKASVKAINMAGNQTAEVEFDINNYAKLSNEYEIYTGFNDMPSDEPSKKAVSWAVHNGITDKNPSFNGEQALSRRQAMVLLWRLANQPSTTDYKNFSDMPKDDISKTAVSWAVNNGITDKNPEFNGEISLTRRQAMVLLWRIVGKPESEEYKGFNDMPSDEISKKAVSWAVNNGITDKNPEFNGEISLTRRQAMVLLMRVYNLLLS